MRGIDESLELGARAEMRVGTGEIGHPIAVIARALVACGALHGLVLEDRREPDRGDAHPLQIGQLLAQALEVAAVEEALGQRIEAGHEPVAA